MKDFTISPVSDVIGAEVVGLMSRNRLTAKPLRHCAKPSKTTI